MIKRKDIQIRDPFVLPIKEEKRYYLYGTTDQNPSVAPGVGFDAYSSDDLNEWDGPFEVFRPPLEFWADRNFWAPEVYRYEGRFFMFASFKASGKSRATQILVSESPLGPFIPHSKDPVTPSDWWCLDGTLYIDETDNPWIVFCHEWTQIRDGRMCAVRLSRQLDTAIGEPIVLFTASQAPWPMPMQKSPENSFVTDGPFLHRAMNGELLMLWSSYAGDNGYSLGVARSTYGNIMGPWTHDAMPLYSQNGGHGMLFTAFDGRLVLALHTPNNTPNERAIFLNVEEKNGKLILDRTGKDTLHAQRI
jgi:beta-xylosidase